MDIVYLFVKARIRKKGMGAKSAKGGIFNPEGPAEKGFLWFDQSYKALKIGFFGQTLT